MAVQINKEDYAKPWRPGVYPKSTTVIYDNQLWILNDTITGLFSSSDFLAEVANGDWIGRYTTEQDLNNFLLKEISTYSNASTPLIGTELTLINDGIEWKKVAVSEFSGSTTKKTENLFFQDAIGATVRTITADQKNMHQSRFLANASPFGQLGLTLGNGIPETSGVINLSYFSDVITPQITGDYIGKVKKIVFSYSRNVNESSANTNVMIRVMGQTKYLTDMQLIAEHNLVSTTFLANAEHKVEIPVLTHLPLSAFSNIGWCIRSNNATAQQFTRIKINVIVEEV